MHAGRWSLRTVAVVFALSLAASAGARALGDDPDFPDAPKQKGGTMEEQLEAAQQAMRKNVDDSQARQQEQFEQLSARMEAQYQALQERMDAQREQFRKRVAQQWSDVAESSQKMWVDYSKGTDARSKVDFEKGEVEVEVLIPVEQIAPGKQVPDATKLDRAQQEKLRALAEEKLKQQTQRMLSQKDPAQAAPPSPAPKQEEPPTAPEVKQEAQQDEPSSPRAPAAPVPVLEGQLTDSRGRAVTEKDATRFAKELAGKAQVEPKPVVGADGKARVKVKVKVPMVEGHLKVRADRYAESVNAAASKLGLDPSLVFSVIHTESAFNPMAQSSAGAYGLMQLLPKQGAHEAYKWLYKREKAITPEDLYDPATNIALGSAYLAILAQTSFGQAKSKGTQQVLSIAAYNCGPTRVKKSVITGHPLATLAPEQAASLVEAKAPDETKKYLVRVRERMALYR